jgi:hypothetical protein
MSTNDFYVNDERIVHRDRVGAVNGRHWANTGKYWALGTNVKSRTSASRGTHKVFKSRAPELAKVKKERMKAEVNALANRMLAANFGTRVQYKMGPNGKMVKYNIAEYANYSPELKESLAAMGIRNRPNARAGPGAASGAPNNNDEDLSGLMGKMGIGRGGRKHRLTKRRHSKRRHTKRRN